MSATTDLLPGEIVRLKEDDRYPALFGTDREFYSFVQFRGEFDGQAVVEDANGRKRLAELANISRVSAFYEHPERGS